MVGIHRAELEGEAGARQGPALSPKQLHLCQAEALWWEAVVVRDSHLARQACGAGLRAS